MMKSKLKNILIPFILMITVNFVFSSAQIWSLGLFSAHVGILYICGLFFGPYGALGAVFGNFVIDLMGGFSPIETIPSSIINFGISYLAYKLWYSGFKTDKLTKPALDNVYHLALFLSSILICGAFYSIVFGNLVSIEFIVDPEDILMVSYFLNFINIAFIFGIIGIWISKRIDFVETPKTSKRKANKRLYNALFCLLIISTAILLILVLTHADTTLRILGVTLFGIILYAYLTKPNDREIVPKDENTLIEKIMTRFILITLFIAIIGLLISISSYNYVESLENLNIFVRILPGLIITDTIIILFFIPGLAILRYVETRVIKPISSFSKIENFITENEKIESEGLVNIYSEYINEENEIGTLARSYTDLIEHNNNYIQNIQEIEGEKERIKAELDIATKIQAAALPKEPIENDDFIITGYSKPAREVGGDFFDYYMLDDDNLAVVIGDASGKGVPAALVAIITQAVVAQMLKYNKDPSNVLHDINNELSENNPEMMFITLWLGIYNRTTKKLTFSNAGHNPPLIKENNGFEYLDIESGIVLGVMGEFEYVNEELELEGELVLYTDGITDANNNDNEMYSEARLLNLLNELKDNTDPINYLLADIDEFCQGREQFDDMTLLHLRVK